jgi:hypothetical protein
VLLDVPHHRCACVAVEVAVEELIDPTDLAQGIGNKVAVVDVDESVLTPEALTLRHGASDALDPRLLLRRAMAEQIDAIGDAAVRPGHQAAHRRNNLCVAWRNPSS